MPVVHTEVIYWPCLSCTGHAHAAYKKMHKLAERYAVEQNGSVMAGGK